MSETTWIKFSERGPTEADLPLMAWEGRTRHFCPSAPPDEACVSSFKLTHWRSLPKDLPVVVNEDEEAKAMELARLECICLSVQESRGFKEGWKEGRDWERSRGRKP